MTAPVDVLAVLDATILAAEADARMYKLDDAAKAVAVFKATRAAVAELIEADKEYDEARRWWDQGCYVGWDGVSDETRKTTAERFEAALYRRFAALARVQGVQS